MTALVKQIDGWSVAIEGDEPTILDEELGARLGFARPRKIRDLIERMLSEGIINDSEVRTTAGQTSAKGGRPGIAYHLTETAAILVIARSNTKLAHAITRQVVQVFIAVRRGQLAAPEQVPVLATSPLVGDGHLRGDMSARCAMAARCLGVRIQRVHGFVRRQFKVPGIYQLPVLLYPMARDLLEALALGRLLLPPGNTGGAPPAADPKQTVIKFPGSAQ